MIKSKQTMKNHPILLAFIPLLSFVLVSAGQTPTLYTTVVSNDNPLLYWNFDAGGRNAAQQMPVAFAAITTQNDLIPTEGAARVSHGSLNDGLKLGNAASLSGSNYFYAADMFTGSTALTNAFAVEFWMKSLASNTSTYLYNIGNNDGEIIYNFNPDYLELYAGAGGRTGTSGPQITDTNWHYVLCVYYGSSFKDLADEVDFYVDVTNFYAVKSLDINASLPLNQDFIFGAATTVPQNAFNGILDEFAIYDLSSYTDLGVAQTAMTNMALAHMFAATNSSTGSYSNAVVASSPYLYWNFDEASGPALQLMPITPPPLNNALNDLVPSSEATYVTHASLNDGLQLGDAAQLNGASWFSTAGALVSGLPGSINGPWAVEFWMQDTEYPQSDRYLIEADGTANIPSVIYGYNGENIEAFGPGGAPAPMASRSATRTGTTC